MAESKLTLGVCAVKRRTCRQIEVEEKWNNLAELVALEEDKDLSHVNYSKKKGSLVVIGSGIKCVSQFSTEAISHLKNADKVLYCVSDPATEHFINDLCPDALDLYVLYDNGKPRYETYVQMAEVTLHYARQGLNTVMVFYGHPGIFVMPTHRAIKTAQQQGIQTTMLPAISALDCLVADLGIDSSYPGMITYEATDLLLHNRTLLTDMHVVLWQVGCVGEFNFSRTGYTNRHLPILINHLQSIYGDDYIITHYIGAQYPMCSSTIVQLPLYKIVQPDVTKTITNISTFYIPPKEHKNIAQTNAELLDLESHNQKLPLIQSYGPQEKEAIRDLLEWKVPHGHSHFTPTKVGNYLGKLAQDVNLLKEHKNEPIKTMKKKDLPKEDVSTLLRALPHHISMIMKTDTQSIATKVVIRILSDPKFSKAIFTQIQKHKTDPKLETKMNQFLTQNGYSTTFKLVYVAFTNLRKTNLLPWCGVYTTNQSITITIIGNAHNKSLDKVYINTTLINKFTFTDQTLTWSNKDGNSSSASLVFTGGEDSHELSFSGKYWLSKDGKPTTNNISGQNNATKASLSNWVGSYDTKLNGTTGLTLTVVAVPNGNYKVSLGNTQILHYTFRNDFLSWSDSYDTCNGEITFSMDNDSQHKRIFSGYYWVKGSTKPQSPNYTGIINVNNFSSYIGMYRSIIVNSKGTAQHGLECFLTNQSNTVHLNIGTTIIKSPTYSNSTIIWSMSSGNTNNGSITFYINRKKHTPSFHGKTWTGNTIPSRANIYGSLDTTYLKEWAGVYNTYSQFDSNWSPGGQLVVNAAISPEDIQITYGATSIKSPVFNNPVLTWSSQTDGNITNARIIFYYPKNSTSPKCYGKLWIDKEPTGDTFKGEIHFKHPQSSSGNIASIHNIFSSFAEKKKTDPKSSSSSSSGGSISEGLKNFGIAVAILGLLCLSIIGFLLVVTIVERNKPSKFEMNERDFNEQLDEIEYLDVDEDSMESLYVQPEESNEFNTGDILGNTTNSGEQFGENSQLSSNEIVNEMNPSNVEVNTDVDVIAPDVKIDPPLEGEGNILTRPDEPLPSSSSVQDQQQQVEPSNESGDVTAGEAGLDELDIPLV